MWKSAIALAVVVVAGLACRGDATSGSERPPIGSSGSGSDSGVAHVDQALSKIVATAAETVGTIEIRRSGQIRWEQVAVGTTFRERDWVRTGSKGFVRLRFGTRGFLDLTENTTLLVDSGITVETGTVVGVAMTGQPLIVNAVDGSQAQLAAGTDGPAEFRLTPSDNKGVEIAVLKGSIRVMTPDGERLVGAGEATDLAGKRTGNIVKLLGYPRSLAPGVDARFLYVKNQSIPLTWTPVPNAARYNVQIATDTDFHSLALVVSTTSPNTTLVPDHEGVYMWRVAAVDPAGRVGEHGFGRRIYVEHDQPKDMLVAPRDGTKIEFPNKPPAVEMSWRAIGDVSTYKVVMWRGAPGGEPFLSKSTTTQTLTETLDEGTYTWGVYAMKGDAEEPIFLRLRQLIIKKQQGPQIRTEVQWK